MGRHRIDEGLDHPGPTVAIHRPCAHIDLRVALRGFGRFLRSIAAVVVGVDVQHHVRTGGSEAIEPGGQVGVQLLVQPQRRRDLLLGQRGIVPDLEIPAVLGPPIDRLLGRAVEVHLKARSVHDQAGGDLIDEPVGEGVLLAEPVRFRECHERHELGAQIVARVNGSRHDRPVPGSVERISLAAHSPIQPHP